MRTLLLKLLILVCASLVVRVESRAQPLMGYAESLECMVANADLVFVAKLVKYGDEQQTDGVKSHVGTIAIEETLKRDAFPDQPYRNRQIRIPYISTVALANWRDQSVRLLVIEDGDDSHKTKVIPLTNQTLEFLTADFKILREPEAVLRIARETVRRMPAPIRRIHTFTVSVPRAVVAETKWKSYHGMQLEVPVDERLEKRAEVGIRSEDFSTRLESARALRYFKTDENIARMKMLLNDPGWAYLYVAQENKGVEVRIYSVREAAYAALKLWGIDAERPIIREEVKK